MPISPPVQPLVADDATLRAVLLEAELPPLLTTLAHITGDMSLLEPELRPPLQPKPAGVEPQGGMSPEHQERARSMAFEALRRFRDGGCRVMADPGAADLHQLMRFITGEAPDEYVPLMMQELGLPADHDVPEWTKQQLAPDRDFSVVVIGAGMSGLVAAYRLKQAGVPFVVLEKNPDVGGTWFENRYPGCRLDTNNFAYSFSFAQKADWPQQFSPRDAIHGYFRDVAEELGLREHIRFSTEVVSAAYDDDSASWTVRARGAHGAEQVLDASAVITAVGQLNRPHIPDIPGREGFRGRAWHSAQWVHDVDLSGKRVAVIGTGASAYQVVPSIAGAVSHLSVFQRTPPWMLPTPTYHEEVAPGLSWLFHHVPYYHRWFRFYQFWISVEGRRPFVQVDPEWEHEISVSAANEALRSALVQHLRAQFGDRPDLLEQVMPAYPPGAKRMMRDNGVWPAALKQDNVSLVTAGIEQITPYGIRSRDGVLHEVDVIIYATGFQAADFLAPMTIRGRGGFDLHERWKGDARAYLGIAIPDFPNLFCIYGPNTNLVINGSILLFSECAVHYILECIRAILASGCRAIDVRQQSFDTYNRRIDEGNLMMAWGASTVHSWYKNAFGRSAQNWPFSILEYYQLTRHPDVADHVLL